MIVVKYYWCAHDAAKDKKYRVRELPFRRLGSEEICIFAKNSDVVLVTGPVVRNLGGSTETGTLFVALDNKGMYWEFSAAVRGLADSYDGPTRDLSVVSIGDTMESMVELQGCSQTMTSEFRLPVSASSAQ